MESNMNKWKVLLAMFLILAGPVGTIVGFEEHSRLICALSAVVAFVSGSVYRWCMTRINNESNM